MTFITGDFHDLAGLEAEEAHVWCTGVRGYPVLRGPEKVKALLVSTRSSPGCLGFG